MLASPCNGMNVSETYGKDQRAHASMLQKSTVQAVSLQSVIQTMGLLFPCRDSMSEDFHRAMKCFMVEFHDQKHYQASTNYTAMHHLDNIRERGDPRCLHLLGNAKLCYVSSNFIASSCPP